MRLLRLAVAVLVVSASAVYIWSHFDWIQVFSALRSANIVLLVGGSVVTIIAFWLLRTLRWSLLLATVNAVGGSFWLLYFCTASCLAVSIVTPAQSGEALKVEILRKVSGLQRLPGYGCFAVERALDLLCVLQLAIAAVVYGAGQGFGLSLSLLVGSVMAVCSGIGFAAWLLSRFARWQESVKPMLASFMAKPSQLVVAWLLSMAAWLAVVSGWGLCLAAVGVSLSPAQLTFVTSAVTLCSVLSFVPGGLGVSEVSAAIVLGHFGVPPATAQAGALVLRLYALTPLILGLLHFSAFKFLTQPTDHAHT
jgi:uncharacterized membrane protein YbhN (UPF0104 family)